jgi:hypothetical protein
MATFKKIINPFPRDQRKSGDQPSFVQNQITTDVNHVRQNQCSAILTFRTTLPALPGIHFPSNRQRIQRILSDTIPEFCDFPEWTKPIVYSEYEVTSSLTKCTFAGSQFSHFCLFPGYRQDMHWIGSAAFFAPYPQNFRKSCKLHGLRRW